MKEMNETFNERYSKNFCTVSNVTGYQIASLGFSHCEIQGFYRAGKFNYFLSNNATVESRMLHQRLTWHRDNNGKFHWAFGTL